MRDLAELNLNQIGSPIQRTAPTADVIFAFEREMSVSLPEDYIQLLIYCNGGHPELNLIDPLGGSDLPGEGINHFCHLDEDQKSLQGLWNETRAWRQILGEKVVPIAGDGFGNVYYLDLASTPAKVMFCDHDQNFAVFEVAASFSDFIDSLRFDPDKS